MTASNFTIANFWPVSLAQSERVADFKLHTWFKWNTLKDVHCCKQSFCIRCFLTVKCGRSWDGVRWNAARTRKISLFMVRESADANSIQEHSLLRAVLLLNWRKFHGLISIRIPYEHFEWLQGWKVVFIVIIEFYVISFFHLRDCVENLGESRIEGNDWSSSRSRSDRFLGVLLYWNSLQVIFTRLNMSLLVRMCFWLHGNKSA